MIFLIAGATGVIGQRLVNEIMLDKNNQIIVLTREIEKAKNRLPLQNKNIIFTDYKTGWKADNIDIVINLAGTPVANERWTKKRKQKILNSRLLSTDYIYIRCLQNRIKPKLWITISATGYYGNCGSEEIDENTVVSPISFLQNVTDQIENNSKKITNIVERMCTVRMGLVLINNHGILKKLNSIYKYNIGGTIGSGTQFMPWVHIDDVISALKFMIDNEKCQGIYNLCAPTPCTQAEFSKLYAKTLHRLNIMHIPELMIKCLMGERSELILFSQNAKPTHLLKDNFEFKYKDINDALNNLCTTDSK